MVKMAVKMAVENISFLCFIAYLVVDLILVTKAQKDPPVERWADSRVRVLHILIRLNGCLNHQAPTCPKKVLGRETL
jgi:hypothetical protein